MEPENDDFQVRNLQTSGAENFRWTMLTWGVYIPKTTNNDQPT